MVPPVISNKFWHSLFLLTSQISILEAGDLKGNRNAALLETSINMSIQVGEYHAFIPESF